MRKKYIKIGIVFLCILVVSIFLSRTMSTILTPKADFFSGSQSGEIKSEYELTGMFRYDNQTPVYWDAAVGNVVIISSLKVNPGDYVEKGDLILECQPFDSLSNDLKQAEVDLNNLIVEKAQLLETMERQNMDIESHSVINAREYMQSETRMIKTKATLIYTMYKNELIQSTQDDISDDDIGSLWMGDDFVSEAEVVIEEGVTPDEYQLYLLAKWDFEVKEYNYKRLLSQGISVDFNLILQWDDLAGRIEQTEKDLVEYLEAYDNSTKFYSPKSGYVVDVNISWFRYLNGDEPVMYIEEDGYPKLYVESANLTTKETGSNNTYRFYAGGKLWKATYEGKFVDESGTSFLKLGVQDAFWTRVADPREFFDSNIEVLSTYNAGEYNTLLPASAVMHDGENFYIYTAIKTSDIWGDGYLVHKKIVSVESYSDEYVAINTNDTHIAYSTIILKNWDRDLAEGRRVMQYIEVEEEE